MSDDNRRLRAKCRRIELEKGSGNVTSRCGRSPRPSILSFRRNKNARTGIGTALKMAERKLREIQFSTDKSAAESCLYYFHGYNIIGSRGEAKGLQRSAGSLALSLLHCDEARANNCRRPASRESEISSTRFEWSHCRKPIDCYRLVLDMTVEWTIVQYYIIFIIL